ncbi:cytochrome b reductase 1 isoform X2 [Contarinia nasturtii]|uniref:cytochrome b reductase 1 isoform X2 n=1 Tax=Contarinia nasturtii TaxID=265458 RepID=UPI0012D4BC64|nr:cytochrome b reductase 1 isoform X2 [Contarinia nasturtii]XP_031620801.1 cytochrome b reductase 1 isoform X2 [Contarinia nasturtii]XP_031620802.1 cytochrome b reductase 1 isoform X2 [Contarinia nasturtii]XP_031620803.1 cytochrome b reductase 1 isoform X2 [Contarinia nasturtii]XP_031620804.1 cytochrome b reductase 1 isoform X2 [Contarinia nasturtii]XP_031620805.1 cytochrome b reductase 1 isoform X2 [Contarinia nasturtii]
MTRGGNSAGTSRYDDDLENTWGFFSWCEYILTVIVSSVLLIGASALTLFWVIYYRDGFAWSENPKIQFNLHPVFMVIGFITLSGFSILLYRLCRCLKHIYAKLAHSLFHTLSIPCIAIGFLAVYDSHNLDSPPKPNFYSLHSWLGMVTMGLFGLQFVIGFFTFLVCLCCNKMTYGCRGALIPVHASLGLATFLLAIASCLSGLTQKAIWTLGENYSKFTEEGVVINSLGCVLIALAILVSFAIRRSFAPATAKVYVTERI